MNGRRLPALRRRAFRAPPFLLLAALAAAAFLFLFPAPGSAQSGDEPLTARFLSDTGPSNHEGDGQVFTIRIEFSEDIATGYKTLRDHALAVDGGTARKFKRVNRRSSLWEIHVSPSSDAAVQLTLSETTDCTAPDAVCTSSNKPLSHSVSITIPGPVPTPTPEPEENTPATGLPVSIVTPPFDTPKCTLDNGEESDVKAISVDPIHGAPATKWYAFELGLKGLSGMHPRPCETFDPQDFWVKRAVTYRHRIDRVRCKDPTMSCTWASPPRQPAAL